MATVDTFFETEHERNEWLRINAEHQIESDKNSDCGNRFHPRSMEDALQVARNQLDYDMEVGKLRFTLEELREHDHAFFDARERQYLKNLMESVGLTLQ